MGPDIYTYFNLFFFERIFWLLLAAARRRAPRMCCSVCTEAPTVVLRVLTLESDKKEEHGPPGPAGKEMVGMVLLLRSVGYNMITDAEEKGVIVAGKVIDASSCLQLSGVRVLIRQELSHTSSLKVKWKAVELALGLKFSRDKCDVKLVGTPLMHRRFLRRNRGTFGPAIKAGDAIFPTADDGSCGRAADGGLSRLLYAEFIWLPLHHQTMLHVKQHPELPLYI